MRMLITGCAGFIGMHVALAAKKRGDTVIGIDNFNDYYTPGLKRDRARLMEIPICEGDICDQTLLQQLITKYDITHFVHLAAQAGVRYSLKNPMAYIKSNIEGFTAVLEAIRKHPRIPLIYASSSSVYGTNSHLPFSVDDHTDRPANLYGATKKANEVMAFSYHHLFGLKVTGLRFFTVYGPWGRPDMAYFSFAEKIMKGDPIEVYNKGDMSRDFTYIDDIVNGTLSAIDLSAPCELFNLGNNHPEELKKLISLLEKGLKKQAVCHYLPMQAGDMLSTYADIKHSQERLRFQPKITLEEGMDRFIQWYSTYNKGEKS